ncbi:hypothetical protein [Rhizobium sp. BT-175]|uniref:hypothetical protein n=1 Tax=Rhizobium sp. BT-175 TaxID=2986929 RepID=UPI0022369F6B|nr:hypothetical protein [Rhizobium sp. BT-175]MCV9941917.1 hypothetical protein [Rhizobium sp. BT-175]
MLAGWPSRYSSADLGVDAQAYEAFVKLRLGHSKRGSVIVPELVLGKFGPWRFFQPTFFGPCQLGWDFEPGVDVATFSVDLGPPRSRKAGRSLLRIRSDERAKCYEDGSQLYRCELSGPRQIAHIASGRARRTAAGDFEILLYHHTTPANLGGILVSRELWSSAWNLQGTRRLENVAYTYFTSLEKIGDDDDLHRIAMASNGQISFQTTSSRETEATLTLNVYRGSTKGRTSTVARYVPVDILAAPHLYFHHSIMLKPAWYEIVCPEIYRVGVKPGAKLALGNDAVGCGRGSLKLFDHVALGDTSELSGLAAPYDEETTDQLMHTEMLGEDIDLFQFWRRNANTDQVSGRTPEARVLEPR